MPWIKVRGQVKPVTTILFDKDGTLLDFLMLWGKWAEVVTRLMGSLVERSGGVIPGGDASLLGTQHDEHGKVVGYDKEGPLAMASEEETLGLLAWQLYRTGIPWNKAIVQVKEINHAAMQEARTNGEARPIQGLVLLLDKCKDLGIRLGVVTTDQTENAREHLRAMSIEHYFEIVIGHDRVGRGKPAPDMVQLACRELGTLPEQTVVIGDSDADMQMGRAAGAVLTIGYTEREEEGSHLAHADVRISSYDEINVY